MNTTVDILINPVTLRFSYHNSELIYMFASHPEQQLDEMEKLMGVTTDDGPIFDTNVGFLPVASTTLIRGEKNIKIITNKIAITAKIRNSFTLKLNS